MTVPMLTLACVRVQQEFVQQPNVGFPMVREEVEAKGALIQNTGFLLCSVLV